MSVRRRIVRTLIVALLILLAAAVAYWRNALARQWHNARSAYWREKCAAFVAPSLQVVFEEDPTRAAALLRTIEFAQCATAFGPAAARRRVRPLERYLAVPGASQFKPYYVGLLLDRPVLFYHEVQRPDGTKVILVITYDQERSESGRRSYFRVLTCDRRVFLDGLVPQVWGYFIFRNELPATTARPVRFFAGELVNGEPNSCSISYQLGDEWGRFTFTLQPDDVVVRRREGPLP